MKKRCIIWGLETPHTSSALLDLQADQRIEICAWFGDKSHGSFVTHHIYDFQGKSGAIKSTKYRPVQPTSYETVFSKALLQLLEVTSRSYQTDIKSFQDLIDIVSAQLNYLEALMVELKPELILFHNIPHEGPDFILYELALAHGIKTLICTQSLFENRFFIFQRIEELGQLNSAIKDTSYKAPIIERRFEKEFFYMKGQTPTQLFIEGCKQFFWSLKIVLSVFSILGLKKTRRYFYRFFYWHDFVKNKRNVVNNNIRLNDKYVYFPLHLQPEMTTASLGGIYCDQLLAIERLRDLIPSDWTILIKENPKQTYFRRGNHFFERLSRIPKVQYCTAGNTHKLIENSQFVATISGSAGWEALCGGKSVLLFGVSWYQHFPGVFKYSASLDFSKLSKCSVDLSDLQNAFYRLMSTSFGGVVDPAYIVMLKNYDCKNNNSLVREAIAARIHSI